MSEVYKKLGDLLKTERERQSIKIEKLAEQLKISQANLEAIENGNPSEIPSNLYYNLFAKSYSEALGIDFNRTMEAIEGDVGPVSDLKDSGSKSKAAPDKENRDDVDESDDDNGSSKSYKNLIWLFGIIVVAFIIFLGVNKLFLGSSDSGNQSDGSAVEGDQTTGIETGISKEELAGYDWDKAVMPGNDKIKLRLLPRENSWATIIADGDTVIYRTLNAGRIYDAEADYRILISVGIPSVVKILLNDQEVNLVNPDSRRISRVEINQMNLSTFIGDKEIAEEPSGDDSSEL